MFKTSLQFGLLVFLWACQTVPDPSSQVYVISAVTNNPLRKTVTDCTFRYKLDNSFSKLDNQTQQQSVRAAFDLWQDGNPNITFIQRQDAFVTELIIRFVPHSEIQDDQEKAPYGLIRGTIATLSSFREENKSYTILLDSDFDWDGPAITRVLAYHIGVFLGMAVSEEKDSMLNHLYLKETVGLSDSDKSKIRSLYPKPCNTSCNNFLPLKLDVLPSATRSIRLDKQGKISITASGSMVIGFYLGWSTPTGLEKGLFNFPIGDYSLERAFNHAALVYKVNNEPNWRLCGTSCEFTTDGVSQCTEVTFAVNDKDLRDNSGSYNVTVDYK